MQRVGIRPVPAPLSVKLGGNSDIKGSAFDPTAKLDKHAARQNGLNDFLGGQTDFGAVGPKIGKIKTEFFLTGECDEGLWRWQRQIGFRLRFTDEPLRYCVFAGQDLKSDRMFCLNQKAKVSLFFLPALSITKARKRDLCRKESLFLAAQQTNQLVLIAEDSIRKKCLRIFLENPFQNKDLFGLAFTKKCLLISFF